MTEVEVLKARVDELRALDPSFFTLRVRALEHRVVIEERLQLIADQCDVDQEIALVVLRVVWSRLIVTVCDETSLAGLSDRAEQSLRATLRALASGRVPAALEPVVAAVVAAGFAPAHTLRTALASAGGAIASPQR